MVTEHTLLGDGGWRYFLYTIAPRAPNDTVGLSRRRRLLQQSSHNGLLCQGHSPVCSPANLFVLLTQPLPISRFREWPGRGSRRQSSPSTLASSHFHQGRSGKTLKLLAKVRTVARNQRPSSGIQEMFMSKVYLGSASVSHWDPWNLGLGRCIPQHLKCHQNFLLIFYFHFHDNLKN